MKMFRVAAFGTLLVIGVGSEASAYSLSPMQTKFTLTGVASVFYGASFTGCPVTLTGIIPRNSRNSSIQAMVGSTPCGGLVGTNLPWPLRAKNGTKAQISNFTYTVPGNVCGPVTIHPTVDANGVWTWHLRSIGATSVCVFDASLQSTPPITIVP